MNVKFDEKGLIPVITQDYETKEVLILSYMNKEALEKTLEEENLYYYSRSRKTLWKKGETSGHTQLLKSITYDCDQDAILAQVIQKGPACHTGETTCFHHVILGEKKKANIISVLEETIETRKNNPIEGSYTNYLFESGKDKILKKIGEEAAEVIIASKNNSKEELVYEMADLIYHSMVLLANDGVPLKEIQKELESRHGVVK